MRRVTVFGALALATVAVLGTVVPARALLVAPPPAATRVGLADVIVVGKVASLEKDEVAARQFPSAPQTANYKIAVVSVTDPVLGAKGKKTIRVGFIVPANVPPGGGPGGGPGGIRPIRRYPQVNLTAGQEALMILTRHFEQDFYVAGGYFDVINKQDNPNFAKEVANVKHAVKLLADPTAGLKSKDAEERLQTAALLVARYRTQRPGVGGALARSEPIDAEQSKLILGALAQADWNQQVRFGQPHPWVVFNQLGLTVVDGWSPPQNVQNIQQLYGLAQDWLRQHAGTYRIQRYVNEPSK